MKQEQQLEYWLRGLVEDIIPVLQPVAHAILQAQLEVRQFLENFPGSLIWERPSGVASIAFHLQHLPGVLDRLFTYARGEQLSAQQLNYLQKEGKEDNLIQLFDLLNYFDKQVKLSIEQLRHTDVDAVFAAREVGRKKIPSTVLGLLFHAAEHTQRHTGQLLVTARIVMNQ